MGAADTDPMAFVEVWDRALRAGDWEAACGALAEDATYVALNDESATCTDAEQIMGLMRSWKGKVPDVEVVEWERSARAPSPTSGSRRGTTPHGSRSARWKVV